MIKVRIKFSKHGPVRFVGHLDLMRYFQKVMRRAGVDIAYSEGYSPHQLMSFAQPLPAGATSDGEYADLTLVSFRDIRLSESQNANAKEELSGEDALKGLCQRMNSVMHEGITVTDAAVLSQGAEKAMTSVAACRWRLAFRAEDPLGQRAKEVLAGQGGTKAVLTRFLQSEQIVVRKKTKKAEKDVDLKPLIHEAEADADGVIRVLMKAGSVDNVRPALFAAALLSFADDAAFPLQETEQQMISALQVHREETYLAAEEEGREVLLPLIPATTPTRV
ncbi:MAG: DUF2344 domain-containing protein [Lachnospiraceae bacterium]|nr:DUF2344 domain-containing protein [Lachnospiraceae bacterium]